MIVMGLGSDRSRPAPTQGVRGSCAWLRPSAENPGRCHQRDDRHTERKHQPIRLMECKEEQSRRVRRIRVECTKSSSEELCLGDLRRERHDRVGHRRRHFLEDFAPAPGKLKRL